VIRRSRNSGNLEKSRRWIPAYAGMTVFSSFPYVIVHGNTSLCRKKAQIQSGISQNAEQFSSHGATMTAGVPK
jgi:hypothetical protein